MVHRGGTSIRQVPLRAVVSQHRGMYRYFADRRRPAWVQKPLLAVLFGLRGAGKAALTATGLPLYRWAHRGDGPGRARATRRHVPGRGRPGGGGSAQ